jgi:hypothetical protein
VAARARGLVLAAGDQAQELAAGEAEQGDLVGEGLVAEVSVAPVEVAGPVAEVALVARLMQAVCGNQAKAPVAEASVRAVEERGVAVAVQAAVSAPVLGEDLAQAAQAVVWVSLGEVAQELEAEAPVLAERVLEAADLVELVPVVE